MAVHPSHRPHVTRLTLAILGLVVALALSLIVGATPAAAQSTYCASHPLEPYCSSTAGQQELDAYNSLTLSQRTSPLYSNVTPTRPTVNGQTINTYTDWSGTGATAADYEQAEQTVVSAAQQAGRFRPAFSALGRLVLPTVAGYVAYKLTYAATNRYIRRSIGWASPAPADVVTGSAVQAGTYGDAGTGGVPTGTVIRFIATISGGSISDAPFVCASTGLQGNGNNCNSGDVAKYNAVHGVSAPGSHEVTYGASGNVRYVRWYTSAEAESHMPVIEDSPYTSQTVGSTVTYTVPSDQGTTADQTATNAAVVPASATWATLTPGQQATVTYVVQTQAPTYSPSADYYTMPNCLTGTYTACNTALDAAGQSGSRTYTVVSFANADVTKPAATVLTQATAAGTVVIKTGALTFTRNPDAASMPLLVLAPGANETYTSYIARLQAAGYVGTATSTTLADDQLDPSRGPGAVVRTQPVVGTRILPGDAVTVYVNPASAPGSTPGDSTATNTAPEAAPGSIAGSGCNGYLTASPDLTPLEVASPTDKFPFAIFSWLSTALTSWSGTGTAPVLNVPLPFWSKTMVVDFATIEPAMPVLRATFVIIATLGLIWWLATALMGFGASTEPTS